MGRQHRLAMVTALSLALCGAVCIGLRVKYLRSPSNLRAGDLWRLTYDIEFRPDKPSARLYVALPSNTALANVTSETFVRRGIIIDILHKTESEDREAVAVAPAGSGPVGFTAHFHITINPSSRHSKPFSQKLPASSKVRYLQSEKSIQKDDPNVIRVLHTIMADKASKTDRVQAIFDYCFENLAPLSPAGPADAAAVLRRGRSNALGTSRAMVALCRAARIPARLVSGFVIEDTATLKPSVWVEVYLDKQWTAYDPHNGYHHELPAKYLSVRHGDASIVRTSANSQFRATYSAKQLYKPRLGANLSPDAFWNVFDLTRLPISMKKTLALILLLPLGALITAFWRNLIGIQTFGTFTPALLGLSLLGSGLKVGLTVLVVILGVGLLCRIILQSLRLLAVPRLGVILTGVILCLAVAVSISEYLGLAPTARSILLPVVITTMMVERFFITIEQDGVKRAFQNLGATAAVGLCCLVVLRWPAIGQMVLVFPELHLFTIAVFIMLGRYSGYRITELFRFHDVAMGPRQDGQAI